MGRSRRRLKKHRTKVSRRPPKKPRTSSKLPLEIIAGKSDLEKKLGRRANWDVQDGLDVNYAANGFLADPNAGFGRNLAVDHIKERAMALENGSLEYESDDDLRQFEGKLRRDGKRAQVNKPTFHQQRIIERLLDAHGEDIEAMVKDRKLNSMLLPASKLRKLIEGNKTYGKSGRCSFRVKVKGL